MRSTIFYMILRILHCHPHADVKFEWHTTQLVPDEQNLSSHDNIYMRSWADLERDTLAQKTPDGTVSDGARR